MQCQAWPRTAVAVAAYQHQTKDKRMEEFSAWLQGKGHQSCNLRLHTFPPSSSTPGFGTIAGPGGISKGQVVVQVPLEAFMSEETALSCPQVGPLIERAGMTPWQGLCLHLLFERAKGLESSWYPYLALLPSELEMCTRHPLMWPQGMCQKWLEGSPMLAKLEGRFMQCKKDYEAMLDAGANALAISPSGGDFSVTEASIRWAASILLSRAFSLDLSKQDEDMWDDGLQSSSQDENMISDGFQSNVLVPWADMLNHSSSAGKQSCLKYDSSKRVAWLSAHKSYEEGEQVFDSYGPNLSPSALLLDYGFVDLENKNYAIDIPATHLGPIRGKTNKALLDAIGLPADGTVFSITELGVDDSVLAWTRVAVASLKELADAGWDADVASGEWTSNTKAASSMAHFNQPVSRKNESEVLKRLLSICGTFLTQYPTTLDEDLASLETSKNSVQSLPWGEVQSQRAVMAEKRALRAAWKIFYVLSKKLQDGVERPMLYIRKKRKVVQRS